MVGGLLLGAALIHLTLAALGDDDADRFAANLPPDQANRAWACRSAFARFFILDGYRFKALDQQRKGSTEAVWLLLVPPDGVEEHRVGCLYEPNLTKPALVYWPGLRIREPTPPGPNMP